MKMLLQRQNTLASTGSSSGGGGDHDPKSSKAAGSHGGNGKAKARSPSGGGGGGSGGINCNTNKSSDSGRGSGAGSSHGGTVADSPISSPDVTGEFLLLCLTLTTLIRATWPSSLRDIEKKRGEIAGLCDSLATPTQSRPRPPIWSLPCVLLALLYQQSALRINTAVSGIDALLLLMQGYPYGLLQNFVAVCLQICR